MLNKIGKDLTIFIAKSALERFPIEKNHSARWFFDQYLRGPKGSLMKSATDRTGNKIKVSNHDLWYSLDLKSRSEYFALAQMDALRYKTERILWIAEFGSLITKYGNRSEDLMESLSDLDKVGGGFDNILNKNSEQYKSLVLLRSTEIMLKYLSDNPRLTSQDCEKLIAAMPSEMLPILVKPRKPISAHLLYQADEREKILKSRLEKWPNLTVVQVTHLMWRELTDKQKLAYHEKYTKLKQEYDQAMEEYKKLSINTKEEINPIIDKATKESKELKRAVRRKLRDSGFVPRQVRNPFNFFVMENKSSDVHNLSELWKSLSSEDKARYEEMSRRDTMRYQSEKALYDDFMQAMFKLFNKKMKPPKSISSTNSDLNEEYR